MTASAAEGGGGPARVSVEQRVGMLKDLARTMLRQVEVLDGELPPSAPARSLNLQEAVRRLEVELIRQALAHTRGHQRGAAKLLGLKATTLNEKMKRYGIRPEKAGE